MAKANLSLAGLNLNSSLNLAPSPLGRVPSIQTREQKGYVWKKGDWWWIRYADWIVRDSVVVRKQALARKLARVLPEHKRLKRPPEVVLLEQKQFIARINGSRTVPERNFNLQDFAQNVWLPSIENRHSASTVQSYGYYWAHILGPRCGNTLLRDFNAASAQQLLNEIVRQNPEMKKATIHKLKSIMSAVFKLAIQQDYRSGPNPMRETSLPRAREAEDTVAYSLDTVLAMLRVIPEPSRSVIAIAAFAGLRRGEIEGLQWESYDGDSLNVTRAMWQGIEGTTKSKKSRGRVPVIAPLRKFLDLHRLRCGKPETGIMFKTRNDTPLSLNNLLCDQIRPALERCKHCGDGATEHQGDDHEYERDTSLPEWHGYHGFRRGLATNLHDLGVDDLTIQKILRHGDVSVTQRYYIKTLPEQSIAAMKKLEVLIDQADLICNVSATQAAELEAVH